MAQVVTLPFSDQEIGQGFNFSSHESLGTGLLMSNVSEDPINDGQIVQTSFHSVTSQESLCESLGISASADVRYGLFSGGAKFEFTQSNAVNSFSSFIAGRCVVRNAMRHGHGFHLTPDADQVMRTGDLNSFKTAFGDMFVRALRTGGEFYVVARITSVSEEHQSKMAASLHGEYNALTVSGSFKAAFDTAQKETNGRSEVTVFISQGGGIGGQDFFTGIDATKILERLSQFPQSAHDHPVAYEAELATYDTIPITVLTPEEREDRNIVLADCLAQKTKLLTALSDLQFLVGPTAGDFFEGLPPLAELGKIEVQYRETMNHLMAHATKVARGQMETPQLFVANPAPPPLNFKKRPVGNNEKLNFANRGMEIARTDKVIAAFRQLQAAGPRQHGFDIGAGITEKDSLWGAEKQKLLSSLDFEEQLGFREAAAFCLGRNNSPAFAAKGSDISEADPAVAAARAREASGLYWLGFDVATGLFGDPARGALGSTAMGPGAENIRLMIGAGEAQLLSTKETERGFNDAVAFHLARRHN